MLAGSAASSAEPQLASAADGKAMLERAIAALKANETAALKAFNDEKNKELKIPPNDPVGQRAYDAVAKAPEGEFVTFTYDFPKPGTKATALKETLETRVGKQACGVSYFKS
jgi:hypothetical protein